MKSRGRRFARRQNDDPTNNRQAPSTATGGEQDFTQYRKLLHLIPVLMHTLSSHTAPLAWPDASSESTKTTALRHAMKPTELTAQ